MPLLDGESRLSSRPGLAIDLAGHRALVTGAGQGVGRSIALTLAAAGAALVVNDVSGERAGEVAAQIVAAGGDAVAATFDVTDWEATRAAVDAGRPIDILVNNAGNAGSARLALAPLVETSPADWEPYLRVNLYGVMHCTRVVLPHMIAAGWGRVVTIVSDAGRTGERQLAAYAAAKAGAAGFSRSVAKEVGRHGITVNCVSLGTMGTPTAGVDLATSSVPDLDRILRAYVIRRLGEPEDAAAMVAFLASPLASWITGQTIPVNGGYSMAL